jgi:hypothetical protein
VRGKLPPVLKNSEVLLQGPKFLTQLSPTNMLVKLRRGTCIIQVSNSGKKTISISADKPLAFTDLADFSHSFRSIPEEAIHAHVDQMRVESKVQRENLKRYNLST